MVGSMSKTGLVLTSTVVVGVEHGKEGANGKDIVVLLKTRHDERCAAVAGSLSGFKSSGLVPGAGDAEREEEERVCETGVVYIHGSIAAAGQRMLEHPERAEGDMEGGSEREREDRTAT